MMAWRGFRTESLAYTGYRNTWPLKRRARFWCIEYPRAWWIWHTLTAADWWRARMTKRASAQHTGGEGNE